VNAREIVQGFSVAAQALSGAASDPRVKLAAKAAARLLGTVARLLERRSAEELTATLEGILEDGAQPITDAELDAQAKAVIDEFTTG